jgi:Ca2+-binding RTX toxin-like protein
MFKHSYLNILRQGALAAAVAVGGASCGSDDSDPMPTPSDPGVNPDPSTISALPANPNGGSTGFDDTLGQQLAALDESQCSWNNTTGTLTVTLSTTKNAATVGLQGSNVVVNGVACPSTGTGLPITTTNLKTLTVDGSTTADLLVIDFAAGLFAMGSAVATNGINIDLKTSAANTEDRVLVRMQTAIDQVVCGATAATTAGINLCNVNANAASEGNIADIKKFTGVERVSFGMGDGADIFTAAGSAGGTPTTATWGTFHFQLPLVVNGGDGDDVLTGGKMADTIQGWVGADTISGENSTSGGNDIFLGGDGVDTVTYAARTATPAEALTIILDGNASSGKSGETDTIGIDVESAIGGPGNDVITGNLVANNLNGGAGNDTINGITNTVNDGTTPDTLVGGDGADLFDQGATVNKGDIIDGGLGVDTIDYKARTLAITAELSDTIQTTGNGQSVATEADLFTSIENYIGGSGVDTVTGSDQANVIDGRGGDDILSGGAGNDTFIEAGLLQTTAVESGGDAIDGEAGVDTVNYEGRVGGVTVTLDDVTPDNDGQGGVTEGDDLENIERVVGTASNDTITGGPSDDVLEGLAGDDALSGLAGSDQLEGGVGTDTFTCGAGDDLIIDVDTNPTAMELMTGLCENKL